MHSCVAFSLLLVYYMYTPTAKYLGVTLVQIDSRNKGAPTIYNSNHKEPIHSAAFSSAPPDYDYYAPQKNPPSILCIMRCVPRQDDP